jgi:hypothetical protein
MAFQLGSILSGDRQAPIRADVLEGIAEKAPIPHLFVLDRDERSDAGVRALLAKPALADRCHVLDRRELENYLLLCPRAVLQALREKHAHDTKIRDRLSTVGEEEIAEKIRAAADGLRATVLVRRIRWDLPGLEQGVLPDADRDALVAAADSPDLATRIGEVVDRTLAGLKGKIDLPALVERHRRELTEAWVDADKRLALAPGEEVLDAVYQEYGSAFRKSKDIGRIARAMQKEVIPDEVRRVIGKALGLTRQPTDGQTATQGST